MTFIACAPGGLSLTWSEVIFSDAPTVLDILRPREVRDALLTRRSDNQERRIPASAVLTAAWSNGSGSSGSSPDGDSTGELPPNATHTG